MNDQIKTALITFKADMKSAIEYIRQYKKAFKEWQRTGSTATLDAVITEWSKHSSCLLSIKNSTQSSFNSYPEYSVVIVRSDIRYMHIAYSLLKGRTLDQIEKTEKAVNEERVKAYLTKYVNDAEIVNSIQINKNSGFIAGIFSKVKELCHVG